MSTIRKKLLAYSLMLVCLLISIRLVKDIVKLWHADERLIEAEVELEAAKLEQVELKQQLEEANQGFWWEKQIRDTLKMARRNEKIVVVPEMLTSESQVEEEGGLDEGKESNLYKWWQVFVK